METNFNEKMSTFEKTYKLPFKFDIPNLTSDFLNNRLLIKAWLKFFRRWLYLTIYGQRSLEVKKILPEHNRILWINLSAPSLGDSLMDLSSRVLIRNKTVDLFTDNKNSHIFEDDEVFSSVFTDKNDVESYKYDLVIIDSFSSRSVNVKFAIAPKTEYVAMFGFYNGPEVNRVLFSFHQMNNLLGYFKTEVEINKLAKSSIFISNYDNNLIKDLSLPDQYVSIALGGKWPHRTYDSWDRVIEHLIKLDININIVLVGSNNAMGHAQKIKERFNNHNITDLVGKYSFKQSAEIINGATLLLCCDGGLMHAANSVETKIIAIFARLRPEMQLTDSIQFSSVYDEIDVNNIPYEKLISCYKDFTMSDGSDPLVE